MKIADVKLNSMVEVENYVSDVIYFQGCTRNCCYCFNPELRNFDGGEDLFSDEIYKRLSPMSKVAVLTGGDPLCQPDFAFYLVSFLKNNGKKVILETSFYDEKCWNKADRVLACIKTFDLDEKVVDGVNKHNNATPVIVIGHECFDEKNYRYVVKKVNKAIYHRIDARKSVDKMNKIYIIAKKKYGCFKVLKKICL